MELLKISAINDIFVDAYLVDEANYLLFLSLWGRDTALQEFIARLSLPASENGIRDFHVVGHGHDRYVQIPNVDMLDKTTAKTSGNTIFGQLTQLWIYDKQAVKPDMSNRRAMMLFRESDNPDPWPTVKTVCHLPLLDHWREAFLNCCHKREWLRKLDKGFGMSGLLIELGDDDVESAITEMIRNRELMLEPEKEPESIIG
ncbi:MAG TPA: hypothetical protein ENI98_10065 [Gammaproteobacteria bacterium]|nr:hypothetical protein [Gammaproteobacteria bacterium]